MIQWIMNNLVIVLPLAVALMDLIMALIPSIASNGIFHGIYLFIKGKIAKPPVA